MPSKRLVLALVCAGVWTTAFTAAQTPAPAAQAPAGQAPAPTGGRGTVAAPAGAQSRFGTRPVASQEVIVRGKAVYDTNCASCHMPNLRGTMAGVPSLLRSGVALRDQGGVLIGPALAKHTPPIQFEQADTVAVAEYIRSVQVNPGRSGAPAPLNVLIGDARAGAGTFQARCGSCHATDAMKTFASKFPDPRALQDAWVSGASTAFAGAGRGGGGGGGLPATVTMADGTQVQGTLVRQDNFIVTLQMADGTKQVIARSNGVPKVEVTDKMAPHVNAIVKLAQDDTTSSLMHDITAYLWSLR
jgi:mono/diheme cytochrome c family protein